MSEFKAGDKVDVYEEQTRIFKNLIVETVEGDEVSFLDKDFVCHVNDIRHVKVFDRQPIVKTEFIVIESHSKSEFKIEVEEYLNKGWTPLSFSATYNSVMKFMVYNQTMAISRDIVPNHLSEETKDGTM